MSKKRKDTTEYSLVAFKVYRVCLMAVMGMCVIAASNVYDVMAKYVLNDKSETTITANSFYFSSNYLDVHTTSTSAGDGQTYENVAEYVMSGWDGMSSRSFQFNIRNYDNVLLYNNEEQNVYYEIGYEIDPAYADKVNISLNRIDVGAAQGIVVYDDNDLDGQGNAKEHTLYLLEGGTDSYTTHNYRLNVSVKDGVSINEDITVRLVAHTVDSTTSYYDTYRSPYYAELMCDITLQYSQYDNFIAYQGFLKARGSNIEDYGTDNYTDTTEYNNSRVALLYELYTSNKIEFENTDVLMATQTIELIWDNDLLELNQFDKKINVPMDEKNWDGFKTSPTDEMKNHKNVVIIETTSEGKKVGHLFFDALAYSAYEIVFHRREYDKNSSVWKDANDEYKWNLTYEQLLEVIDNDDDPLENDFLVYAVTVKH